MIRRDRLLRERIEIAKRQQIGIYSEILYDPIEDDPLIQPMIAEAAAQAEVEVPDAGMGWCYSVWKARQRILRDRFSIEWFTPDEMNPDIMFD